MKEDVEAVREFFDLMHEAKTTNLGESFARFIRAHFGLPIVNAVAFHQPLAVLGSQVFIFEVDRWPANAPEEVVARDVRGARGYDVHARRAKRAIEGAMNGAALVFFPPYALPPEHEAAWRLGGARGLLAVVTP